MQRRLASLSLGALLAGLYLAGAVVAVLFLRTPADVTLFWPAAGIGYAALVRFGLRHAWAIATGQLLLHLLLVPAPPAFMPYSIAANTLAALAAAAYVRRQSPRPGFRLQDGLLLLRGGLLLCLISASIGTLGMVQAGMSPANDALRVFPQWALSDLLGVTATAPTMLFLFNANRHRTRTQIPALGNLRERIAWCFMLVAVMAAVFSSIIVGTMYPMGTTSLPLALLLWSSVRFPPAFTAAATMVVTICLALVFGLGLGGFERPESLRDSFLMMGALAVYSVIPMLLLASDQERYSAMTKLHIRATRDALTGLLNRNAFEEQTRARLATATTPLTLLYADLDHFKLINDSGSHVVGDEMIRHIASLVRAEFDDDALIARTGGDEFAILVPLETEPATAKARALLAAIEAMRVAWQGQNLGMTASIGLATSQPPHHGFDELLSQADTACFEAKELGGNRWFATAANCSDLVERTQSMRNAIAAREALDQRNFHLWCQPIVDLKHPRALQDHFEVLLRWRDKDGQLRPPGELVAAAERYRLGPRLDRYVLDSTLHWLETHPEAAAQVRQCSINLGATTLADEDFGEYFASRLRRSQMRPDQLCLEITETSVVRDLTRTRRFIARMRALGCRFALDDFGTGFCSFSYLRDLDVDDLKIDGSFVRNLEHSELSRAVVRSITEIAHLLGKRAIGEQAETQEQLAFLRASGVDCAQGYVFQRPMPIETFFAATRQA